MPANPLISQVRQLRQIAERACYALAKHQPRPVAKPGLHYALQEVRQELSLREEMVRGRAKAETGDKRGSGLTMSSMSGEGHPPQGNPGEAGIWTGLCSQKSLWVETDRMCTGI